MTDLNDLPREELLQLAIGLGLEPPEEMPDPELRRLVEERQEWIRHLDEAVLDELLEWAGVRRGFKSREELIRRICFAEKADFQRLGRAALLALATLRNIELDAESEDEAIRAALGERKGVGRVLHSAWDFLKKTAGPFAKAPERVAKHGLLGGLGSTVLSAGMDAYIKDKLEEIEALIDRKLEEIDKGLQERRDQEVASRLKILRITLLISVIIAGVSLAYAWVHNLIVGG